MVIHPKEENKAMKEGWDAGGRECGFRSCSQGEASPRKWKLSKDLGEVKEWVRELFGGEYSSQKAKALRREPASKCSSNSKEASVSEGCVGAGEL